VQNKSLCMLEETLGKIVVLYFLFQYPMVPSSTCESRGFESFDLLFKDKMKRMFYVNKAPSPIED
jgi:hypothetical protein